MLLLYSTELLHFKELAIFNKEYSSKIVQEFLTNVSFHSCIGKSLLVELVAYLENCIYQGKFISLSLSKTTLGMCSCHILQFMVFSSVYIQLSNDIREKALRTLLPIQ